MDGNNIEKVNIKVQIAKLDDLDAYKDIRLESLRVNPEAFGLKLEEALARADERWMEDITLDRKFIVLAKVDDSATGAKTMTGAYKIEEEEGAWRV